jgi:hypothetical protein
MTTKSVTFCRSFAEMTNLSTETVFFDVFCHVVRCFLFCKSELRGSMMRTTLNPDGRCNEIAIAAAFPVGPWPERFELAYI